MFVSVVAALVALPFISQSALASSCARTYTVQEGDWCDTISASHNASTYQLSVVNMGKVDKLCSNLQPGQNICLGYQGSDCTDTYVVQGGDTCDGIAQNHRINATVFNVNNPQLNADCDNLYIGEVVCIGSSPAVPALPEGSAMPAATIPPGAAAAKPTAVASSSVASSSVASSSVVPITTPTPTHTPTPSPATDDEDCDDDDDQDSNDDDNDEDLPFCDEL